MTNVGNFHGGSPSGVLRRVAVATMIAFAALNASCPTTVYASPLVFYPFNNPSDGQNGLAYTTFDSSVLAASSVSGGSGLGNFSVRTDGFAGNINSLVTSPGTAISNATAADAVTNNWFFTVSLTPLTTMDLGSIDVDWSRGGTTGVRGWFVRSSRDGFTTDLYTNETPDGAAKGFQPVSINLSGFTGIGATDFRFYIYTPSTGRNMDFLNLQFNPPSSAVPEIDPAGMGSVLALVTGALGLLERRRLAAKARAA